VLSSGNYLVQSVNWNGTRGAVTWVDGNTGLSGTLSQANSLVGSNPNDQVGSELITLLSNGNYLVRSPLWNGARGAATWGDGATGGRGAVSAANSLVGSNPNDRVGGRSGLSDSSLIGVLGNGNYLLRSAIWNGNRGAVTWVSGATGQTLDGQG